MPDRNFISNGREVKPVHIVVPSDSSKDSHRVGEKHPRDETQSMKEITPSEPSHLAPQFKLLLTGSYRVRHVTSIGPIKLKERWEEIPIDAKFESQDFENGELERELDGELFVQAKLRGRLLAIEINMNGHQLLVFGQEVLGRPQTASFHFTQFAGRELKGKIALDGLNRRTEGIQNDQPQLDTRPI